jgi:glucosylglycerate phosphorylase
MDACEKFIREGFIELYGQEQGDQLAKQLNERIKAYQKSHPSIQKKQYGLTEKDAALITYADQIRDPASGLPPLQALHEFCSKHLKGIVNTVHLLPFYPASSDDGFSVIDYEKVDPDFGTWTEIRNFSGDFEIMFDAVFNHISAKSDWFKGFLADDPVYKNFFITVPSGTDLSQVIRPRALPLLTEFETPSGKKAVWTTFSEDQIDLNFRNPEVMLRLCEILLFYVDQGASLIRLDAIAFLWKVPGTTCLHLPHTHLLIQLFRALVDLAAPHVKLITETNVPHKDNVSYFGDGTNEAHLVYNFALPPLLVHTFQSGDAGRLTRWADRLELPSTEVTFFNFLASHDGIGVNPVRGILSDDEIEAMIQKITAHGGLVSYKNTPDGGKIPYELNINYFDALSDPKSHEPASLQIARAVCAHAIMLSLPGMPAIYFHSLFGSRSWHDGVKETGRNRTINRQKLERQTLEEELSDTESLRYRVFDSLARLLEIRSRTDEFNPARKHRVIDYGCDIFAVLREAGESGGQGVLCIHNVSSMDVTIEIDSSGLLRSGADRISYKDLLTAGAVGSNLTLDPYQVCWLKLNPK